MVLSLILSVEVQLKLSRKCPRSLLLAIAWCGRKLTTSVIKACKSKVVNNTRPCRSGTKFMCLADVSVSIGKDMRVNAQTRFWSLIQSVKFYKFWKQTAFLYPWGSRIQLSLTRIRWSCLEAPLRMDWSVRTCSHTISMTMSGQKSSLQVLQLTISRKEPLAQLSPKRIMMSSV